MVGPGIAAALILDVTSVPASAMSAQPPEHLRVRVYVIHFDPLIDGVRALSVAQGWNDPIALQDQYRADVSQASDGIVTQRLVRVSVVREYPVKADGFRFTNASYLGCLADSSPGYCGELIDYRAVLNIVFEARIGSACTAIDQGRVDEVWLWGGPWFGYLEHAPESEPPDRSWSVSR